MEFIKKIFCDSIPYLLYLYIYWNDIFVVMEIIGLEIRGKTSEVAKTKKSCYHQKSTKKWNEYFN